MLGQFWPVGHILLTLQLKYSWGWFLSWETKYCKQVNINILQSKVFIDFLKQSIVSDSDSESGM